VVLPPPYMVESLASGHVDGFCVGAPWNSVAVDSNVGCILHFGCDIMAHVSEKVLAVHGRWAEENAGTLSALVRALARAGEFAENRNNHPAVAEIVARRIGVVPELVVRTLGGNLKTAPQDKIRSSDRYIVIGRESASRPDPVQAAWAYAQIVRWAQAPLSEDLRAAAEEVFRADLYDAALGGKLEPCRVAVRDGIGAFAGPDFDPRDIASYLAAWRAKREHRPRLSIVR
jgi:two-component system, oxyanion-binding sensor